jgi:Domain of unknown function (DUF1963)
MLIGTGAALASLAGCGGCRGREHPGAFTTPEEGELMLRQIAERDEFLANIAPFRTPANTTFHTPPRPVNLLESFPELKPLQRMTHRLHPHPNDEPAAEDSKLGGKFWWPEIEPWPTCEVYRIPYIPVLQLNIDDCPTQAKFLPGTDLLQLLWSPRPHGTAGLPKPMVVWRKKANVQPPLAAPPNIDYARRQFVPVPCRLFPEPVLELPDWNTVQVTPFRDNYLKRKKDAGGDPVDLYRSVLSNAPGSKIGGYPHWSKEESSSPSCTVCRRGMDFLLTLDSQEWNHPSWIPPEDHELMRQAKQYDGLCGLRFGKLPRVHLFVCRRCDGWPVQLVG